MLEETAGGVQATEIKSGATFASDWMDGVHKWPRLAGNEAGVPTLVYGGEASFDREQCHVLSWRDVDK